MTAAFRWSGLLFYSLKRRRSSWLLLLLCLMPTALRHPHDGAFAAAAAASTDEDKNKEIPKNNSSMSGGRSLRLSGMKTTSPIRASLNSGTEPAPSLNQILLKAGKRGLGGGIPGAIAGAVQVVTLMWLRTIINYQCRYGTTFRQALQTLLRQGGVARLYRGLSLALIQAPLARFVSTAANDGVQSLLGNLAWTASWGPGKQTVVASVLVGIWRILLMPIDTMKTVLQVDSTEGFRSLMRRVKSGRITVLYQGSMAQAVSAILGHYPWFYIYNWLSRSAWVASLVPSNLVRNGFIGMMASIVADTCTNFVRVIKTNKQSLGSKHNIGYAETIRMVLAADGWTGLFGRGLKARFLCNALQSMLFTIIWRGLAEQVSSKTSRKETDES